MQVDLLYFDDCPSWRTGLENLESALREEGLQAEIRLVNVASDSEAARLKFLGSPSFQINGLDMWPEERDDFNLSCRVYATSQGMRGSPTIEMLREKLRIQ